jgi:hypothetical protein
MVLNGITISCVFWSLRQPSEASDNSYAQNACLVSLPLQETWP